MNEAHKYAVCFALAKAWASWDEGDRALMMHMAGVRQNDVESIKLSMLQLRDLPGYSINKTAIRAHLEAQLRDHIAEEA